MKTTLLRTSLTALCILAFWIIPGCKAEDRARLSQLVEQLEASAGEAAHQDPTRENTQNRNADIGEPEFPTDALREGHVGRVHHVVDGDTLELQIGENRFKIRFKGSSAPECLKDTVRVDGVQRYKCYEDDEFYGLASYVELLDIIDGRPLSVECESVGPGEICEKDIYDRWLANLVVVGGPDIGEELLRRGGGFTSTGFKSQTRKKYCLAEYEARREGRGMWEGKSVEQTIALMNDSTQRWYRAHDARCDAAIREL